MEPFVWSVGEHPTREESNSVSMENGAPSVITPGPTLMLWLFAGSCRLVSVMPRLSPVHFTARAVVQFIWTGSSALETKGR